jgi:PBSX family phage terminase large subunit
MATAPKLGELQERSIAHANARINIWEGAVRSGKTISSLLRWLIFVARAPHGGALVVCGKTLDTVYRNVFGPLMDPAITGPAARLIKYTRGASSATILGRHIEIITANDARAEGRLRGLTAAGAYVDELTLLPEAFFTQLLARLSVPGAKLFATTNPDGPAHWVRKKYLLRAGELDLRSWHFGLADNPALSPEYVKAIKAEYTGLWYKRFIEGAWVLAEGAIYENWDPTRHIVKDVPRIDTWLGVGLDYGSTNPFAALLAGIGTGPDNIARVYLTHEWRYDSKIARRQLAPSEYAQNVKDWLASAERPGQFDPNGEPLRGIRPPWIFVDPASDFDNELYYSGVNNVADANNEVLAGIRSVSSLIASDRLRVHDSCKGWAEEAPGYSWDDKAAERGEDKPIKVADHSLDAGRYILHSTAHTWRRFTLAA